MTEVFDNPEEAMTKFLQQVIDKVLYVSILIDIVWL